MSVAADLDLRPLNESFARALRASDRSPRTVRSYTDAWVESLVELETGGSLMREAVRDLLVEN